MAIIILVITIILSIIGLLVAIWRAPIYEECERCGMLFAPGEMEGEYCKGCYETMEGKQ
jgi:hypothetical protein